MIFLKDMIFNLSREVINKATARDGQQDTLIRSGVNKMNLNNVYVLCD